jgi:hypothetical protein
MLFGPFDLQPNQFGSEIHASDDSSPRLCSEVCCHLSCFLGKALLRYLGRGTDSFRRASAISIRDAGATCRARETRNRLAKRKASFLSISQGRDKRAIRRQPRKLTAAQRKASASPQGRLGTARSVAKALDTSISFISASLQGPSGRLRAGEWQHHTGARSCAKPDSLAASAPCPNSTLDRFLYHSLSNAASLHEKLPLHDGRNGRRSARPSKPQFVLLEGRKEEILSINKTGPPSAEIGPVWFWFTFLARSQLRRIRANERSPGNCQN